MINSCYSDYFEDNEFTDAALIEASEKAEMDMKMRESTPKSKCYLNFPFLKLSKSVAEYEVVHEQFLIWVNFKKIVEINETILLIYFEKQKKICTVLQLWQRFFYFISFIY